MHRKKQSEKVASAQIGNIKCRNCENIFTGKICNLCGEKIFLEKHLTVSHFIKQILDFFYHYESKVLKSIKLNFIKPGFITKENLNGITVPYAKPVQLFLVINVCFYLLTHFVEVSDYTPALGDHYYFQLSNYSIFKWAAPADEFVVKKIDELSAYKEIIYQNYQKTRILNIENNIKKFSNSVWENDSIPFYAADKNILSKFGGIGEFNSTYHQKVGGYSKSLIFLLIPFVAFTFYLFFYSKLKYFGSALILATHFVVYNLCFFSIHVLVDWVPYKFGLITSFQILSVPIELIFYNKYTTIFSEFLCGGSFEMLHIVFWFPWLFIAFKRLWNTSIWKNILISYVCSRLFFFLIYGAYKKFLIYFVLWMM